MGFSSIIGGLAVGIPGMLVATALFAKRDQVLFLVVFTLIVVGLGYLGITGSLEGVGRQVLDILPA